MNGTFERKTISVPFFPDVLRIGRQTNAKTAPTPANGFFDSKVLSRQHAEIYAERNGRIYIRDVKSSNGTFVNGQRLSPENKESEPHELREQDVLELGIDIVSEDQKTIVHHKVAARVEHAGIYTQGTELNFGDSDPNHQMKRSGSQSSQQSAKANAMAAVMAAREQGAMQQPQWARGWPSTVTTETIVKRLNRELGLAKKQSSELARSRSCLEGLLAADDRGKLEKSSRPSPLRSSKSDSKPSVLFMEPPAPPPQAPLPEKPDVAKALADPVIQPLLMRSETARPILAPNGSPTRADHSQALLILTHELKLAKDQIPNLADRVKNLEEELKQERNARETAEERASLLESSQILKNQENEESEQQDRAVVPDEPVKDETPELQAQLDRLRAAMEDMKTQMEAYRRRAETAESQRDQAHQSLAEMVEQKRKENAELKRQQETVSTPPASSGSPTSVTSLNGNISGSHIEGSLYSLLSGAGINANIPLSSEQAASIQTLLAQKMPVSTRGVQQDFAESNLKEQLTHHGLPLGSGFVVVIVGMALMHYLDGWEKLHR
jgi:pSer/pThr/pTyr-binding forkhead associated (FHA) protein